jgi:pimeloyl-ACP methyl ester carboxylesterase
MASPDANTAALAELAGEGLAGATSRVQELHRAIADRSFRAPGAAPARAVHDAIADGVYAAVRVGGRLAGVAAGRLAPELDLGATRRGALAQSALNGVVGDRLAQAGSPLAVAMAVRRDGRDVALEPDALAAAFPAATGHVVVFVHGLGETEDAWRLRAARRGGTYATRLSAEHAITSVFVRFNSGRHISRNGQELSALLQTLHDAWPVALERLDLVGHSMGGLVVRAACHRALGDGARWIDRLAVTVSLGAPHHGAPLEQATNVLGWLLRRVPEGVPLATVLETRSAGIKDLRYGAITDADWAGAPDALLRDARVPVALHDGARHYAVAATLGATDRHPLSRAFGDALVLLPSAHGAGQRRIGFADEDLHHLPGTGHLALLNDERVEELLVGWLAPVGG